MDGRIGKYHKQWEYSVYSGLRMSEEIYWDWRDYQRQLYREAMLAPLGTAS